MILITGLGNPGKEFLKTRHNVGFDIIDSIHSEFDFPEFSKKFNSLYSKKTIYGEIIVIQKPMSYMNLSGDPIKKIMNFFKINNTEDIFVFHDDLDLKFSKLRIKNSGGHGGHNGIKNIIGLIGPNFNRIKFGIKKSKGEIITIFPSDNEYLIEDAVKSDTSPFQKASALKGF